MPRAFLLKRTPNDSSNSSTSQEENHLLKRKKTDQEKSIRKKKSENLSKMIDEIKLAIKREDTNKNITGTKRGLSASSYDTGIKRSFTVAHLLKPQDLNSERKFESNKSAFTSLSKRKSFRMYEEEYAEFIDFSAGPIANKRKYIPSPSPPPIQKTICTKPCCAKERTIRRDLNGNEVKRTGDELENWYRLNTSARSNESSSIDSYDSGSNTVNTSSFYVKKYKNDREIIVRDGRDIIMKGGRGLVVKNSREEYGRDVIRIYENHDERHCSCSECQHSTKFHASRQSKSRYSESYYINYAKKYENRGASSQKTIETAQDKLANRRTISRRRALLNEIENELSSKKQVKNIEPCPAVKPIKSAADILTIPPGTNRSRAMANLLERRRVAELNNAFETLRKLVPLYGNEDRALSKIKTLRYAMTYIRHLSFLLKSETPDFSRYLIDLSTRDSSFEKFLDNLLKRKIIS